MKIITKPVVWDGTQNPYVDTLLCPMCDKAGCTLDPAVVITDGPEQSHVNLSKVRGKLITMRGHCPACDTGFLIRILLHSGGTYTWHDIGVTAATWNMLLKEGSKDQLPCMCEECQAKGSVKPDQDESTLTAKEKAVLAKAKKMLKDDIKKKSNLTDEDVEELLNVDPSTLAEKAGAVSMTEPDLGDEKANAATIPVIQEQGYALTKTQHARIIKAYHLDMPALVKKTGREEGDLLQEIVELSEAYVRIKFATFQPKESDDPKLPPQFPTIVPKIIFEAFRRSQEKHLCEYLITTFAVVDQVLARPDLPASVVYHHMCQMCKLKTCKFHPTNRPSAQE